MYTYKPKEWTKPHTFNSFNISPVLATFGEEKHLTFPLFREPDVTKQGEC